MAIKPSAIETDVKEKAYLKKNSDWWIVGPFIEGILEPIGCSLSYREKHGSCVAKELVLEDGFNEFSTEKIDTLPIGSWLKVIYDTKTGAKHLICGYNSR